MNEILSWHVSRCMRPCESNEPVPVKVNYVARDYGLALTISQDAGTPWAANEEATIEADETGGYIDLDAIEVEDADDGYLTVVKTGVTTLELKRADGQSSYLIWDESEVNWDSLRAG